MSFFEIYGGKCMDLLNNKKKLQILEDKNNKIQVFGLEEKEAFSSSDVQQIIDYGHSIRTTHQTAANDTSSRSHAICQISIKIKGQQSGKLLLVDLAGSERAADCQSNNRQRRLEGAEINKSLLALKECIRALDSKSNHIPFRASKLTMVLRDSFMNLETSKIVMIACVNPGSSSADHTVNTLRYAERLKTEKTNVAYKNKNLGYLPQHQQNNVVQDIQPQPKADGAIPKPQAAPQNPIAAPGKAGAAKQQPAVAEKKRGGWGNAASGSKERGAYPEGAVILKGGQKPPTQNPASNRAGNGSAPKQMVKKPSVYDNQKAESSPEQKKKKQDDWNYLKQTLKSNNMMN